MGLWFAYEIFSVIFLLFFAIVLTLILNAPVMWLVARKVPRTGAALIIFFLMLIFLFIIGWMVIPKILEQVSTIVTNIPTYASDLQKQLATALHEYPSLQQKVMNQSLLEDNIPSTGKIITGLSQFSFSLIGSVFILIVFFSLVVYMLINPAPLIETYLTLFAEKKREKAALALARASKMMVGWMWSNLVVGGIEAVAVFIFLTAMDVPGVWVWVGLALFAEMIPKLGLYIMAVPPVLIALSINPITALWVLIFYLILNEIMGDFVMPRIRATTMNLHAVSSLIVMLGMAAAFGVVGAIIATPLTAFIKAYYETFYLDEISTKKIPKQIDMVLNRVTEPE